MSKSATEEGVPVSSMAEAEGNDRGAGQPASRAAAPRRAGEGLFDLYRPGQGQTVRWCSAIGGGVLSLAAAQFLFDQLGRFTDNQAVQYLIPVALLVGLGVWIFWLVGKSHKVVDFMIDTEGEMKKVNWSTRREVLGATRVVIFTVIVLGLVLFLVDVGFIFLFEAIGVLRTGMLSRMFGGPGVGG